MIEMLSPDELAAAVTAVTRWTCGASFVPRHGFVRGEPVSGRVFIYPFQVGRRFSLLLSCDRPTSVALAARLACREGDATTPATVESSIREFLGLLAGTLERALAAPDTERSKITQPETQITQREISDGILLRSDDMPGVRLWVVQRGSLTPRSAPPAIVSRKFH